MKKVLAVLGSALLLSFGSASALAAGPSTALSDESATIIASPTGRSAPQALEPETTTLIRIHDTFRHRNPDKAFNRYGWVIASWQTIAMKFTPERNAIVKRIKVGVTRSSGADNDVSLSLREDADGVPGAVIRRQMLWDVPDIGTEAEKRTAVFTPGVPVTAGTTYWVVLKAGMLAPNFDGGWKWSLDDRGEFAVSTSPGEWRLEHGKLSAFSVLGRWAEEGEE